MILATHGIRPDASPEAWREHRFGLPPERWAALRGKPIWVTGAGTGFGRCMAVALAAAEASVFLSGRRPGKLRETLEEMRALGIGTESAHSLAVDITDPEAVTAAAEAIEEQCPALYGLINNAALPPPAAGSWPLADTPVAAWEALMTTNVTGQWHVTRAALPLMVEGGAGRVLFITSEAGWAPTAGFGPYNVSKAALNSLAASFASECAARYPDHDFQINTLVPGEALTEMNKGSEVSPYAVVSMALTLLSHPASGPNGRYFHRDGRHLSFAYTGSYDHPLLPVEPPSG